MTGLTTNTRVDLALLAFLSRQQIYISSSQWKQTQALFHQQNGDSDFFQLLDLLPYWKALNNLSSQEWQKKRDELFRMQERGVQFLLEDNIPLTCGLRHIQDPPRCLAAIGSVETLFNKKALSVVGSREARPELLKWLDQELSQFLKRVSSMNVVSGGARGVDQQAHITAIRNEVSTTLWLPSGVLNMYPSNLNGWSSSIYSVGGVIVSEYHPLSSMKNWYFRQRNRLIVAMSQACWVPQSTFKSGSWMTSCLAADLGIPLFVNAGSPWDPLFSGNTKLLSEGALYLSSHKDLVFEFTKSTEG
jgi:DNA processing protein